MIQNVNHDSIYSNRKESHVINIKKKVYFGKISLSTYSLIIFIVLTVINKFKFGVSLSGVILPISLLVFCIIIEKRLVKFTSSHTICLLFWIFATFSTLLSDIIDPKRDVITFLVFCLFFIACTAITYKKVDLKVLLLVYIITAVYCSANIIWNFSIDFAYGWKRYSLYVLGVYRDPNYVSAFIVPAIGIVFYKLLMCKKMATKKRIIYLSVFIVLIMGALCTGSRATFSVTSIVLVITYLSYLVKINSPKMILKMVLVLTFAFVGWQLIMNTLPEFIIMRLTNFEAYSESSRLILWGTAMELFKSHPFLGTGLGSATHYLFSVGLFDSHNVYLDILIGQGLIGILLLGFMFIRFINVKKKDRLIMILLIFSFFLPLFFINGFNTASFWTPMILCGILSNYSRKNAEGIQGILDEL